MANPRYQDPVTPTHVLESLQTGTDTGLPIIAEAMNPSASQATVTSVSLSASSVQLLAATATRILAIVVNDSDRDAYVKLGTTASLTSFSFLVPPGGEKFLPSRYVGRVDAIWSSAGTGAMRITELTPA